MKDIYNIHKSHTHTHTTYFKQYKNKKIININMMEKPDLVQNTRSKLAYPLYPT